MPIIRDKLSDNHGDNFILKYSYYLDTAFSVFFSVFRNDFIINQAELTAVSFSTLVTGRSAFRIVI